MAEGSSSASGRWRVAAPRGGPPRLVSSKGLWDCRAVSGGPASGQPATRLRGAHRQTARPVRSTRASGAVRPGHLRGPARRPGVGVRPTGTGPPGASQCRGGRARRGGIHRRGTEPCGTEPCGGEPCGGEPCGAGAHGGGVRADGTGPPPGTGPHGIRAGRADARLTGPTRPGGARAPLPGGPVPEARRGPAGTVPATWPEGLAAGGITADCAPGSAAAVGGPRPARGQVFGVRAPVTAAAPRRGAGWWLVVDHGPGLGGGHVGCGVAQCEGRVPGLRLGLGGTAWPTGGAKPRGAGRGAVPRGELSRWVDGVRLARPWRVAADGTAPAVLG